MATEQDIRLAAELGRQPPLIDVRYSDQRAMALLGSPGTTPETDRAAALTLADWARDADELRDWLEMLGLLPIETPAAAAGEGLAAAAGTSGEVATGCP